MNEHMNGLTLAAILTGIVLILGVVGQGDYADAVAAENLRLKAALTVCRAGGHSITASLEPRGESTGEPK